jgi:hypothetical protein
MPRYTFQLQDGERPVSDETGAWFADRERALDHARDVARELMSARELQTRMWRLDVYEDGHPVEQIPFVFLDPTLAHLDPMLRTSVERWSNTLRDCKEAVSAARATVRESRALVARSRGKPYLATDRGEATIRTNLPDAPSGNRRGRRPPRAE